MNGNFEKISSIKGSISFLARLWFGIFSFINFHQSAGVVGQQPVRLQQLWLQLVCSDFDGQIGTQTFASCLIFQTITRIITIYPHAPTATLSIKRTLPFQKEERLLRLYDGWKLRISKGNLICNGKFLIGNCSGDFQFSVHNTTRQRVLNEWRFEEFAGFCCFYDPSETAPWVAFNCASNNWTPIAPL